MNLSDRDKQIIRMVGECRSVTFELLLISFPPSSKRVALNPNKSDTRVTGRYLSNRLKLLVENKYLIEKEKRYFLHSMGAQYLESSNIPFWGNGKTWTTEANQFMRSVQFSHLAHNAEFAWAMRNTDLDIRWWEYDGSATLPILEVEMEPYSGEYTKIEVNPDNRIVLAYNGQLINLIHEGEITVDKGKDSREYFKNKIVYYYYYFVEEAYKQEGFDTVKIRFTAKSRKSRDQLRRRVSEIIETYIYRKAKSVPASGYAEIGDLFLFAAAEDYGQTPLQITENIWALLHGERATLLNP